MLPSYSSSSSSRWDRLERYARWRQRRLPLLQLPEDVLAVVARFLEEREVDLLVRALILPFSIDGEALTVYRSDLVRKIPSCLRKSWVLYDTVTRMEAALGAYTSHALYSTAYDGTCVCIFADWSVFSLTPEWQRRRAEAALCPHSQNQHGGSTVIPIPVAEFSWASPGTSAVLMHRSAILACISECVARRCCCVQLHGYKMVRSPYDGTIHFASYRPILQTQHVLFPPWVVQPGWH